MYLDSNFLRIVTTRVDDCTSVSQLRVYTNRYSTYMYAEEMREIFLSRIAFFKEFYFSDSELVVDCDNLVEDIMLEAMISNVCRGSLGSDITPSLIDFKSFIHNTSEESNALLEIFGYFNGNKLDICRYLDCHNEDLNDKIKQYKLKEKLNSIRREYRNQVVRK